jgi:tetratricopeptide (TPR) repeat protein
MTAATRIAHAAFVLLVLPAVGCRDRSPSTGPGSPGGDRFAEGRPLAMRPVGGETPLDRRIAELQAALRRAPRSPEGWTALGEAWVRKARVDADPGLYHGAGDAADAALSLRPGDPRALLLRGLVLLDAHRFEEARAIAEQILARHPGIAAVHGLHSDALLELGRFEEAAAAAQRMMDLKPSLPSYVRASHLLWLQGDVAGALEAARLAVDAGGDGEARAWARTQAALVRWHRGDLDGADAELARALAESPEHPAALVARGRVALSRRDFAAACDALERAFRRAPLPATAWLLADARAGRGDVAGARELEERVIRDGRAFDRRTLALFLATRGREPAEAVRLAEAERQVRGDVETEDAYAWALYRAGRLAEADRAASRATRLGTPDARLLFHAGAIRVARGDRTSGLALVRRALRLNPEFDLTGAEEARRLLAGEARRPPTVAARRAP